MSDQPVLSNVKGGARAAIDIRAQVSNAPMLTISGGMFQPDRMHISYTYDFDAARWTHSVTVAGFRLKLDGTVGLVPKSATFWHRDDGIPQWVAAFVREYEPSAIPGFSEPQVTR